MGATFSRVKTWIAEILTHTDLNAEFDSILNNFDPDGMDDASVNATAMQAVADPYPGQAISLSTDLRGEIQRLRYMIKQISGKDQWYEDPPASLVGGSWARFSTDGTILASVNITSVVRNSAGNYTVTYDVDFTSANYTGGGTQTIPHGYSANAVAGSMDILTTNASDVATDAGVSMISIGEQVVS